MIEKWGSVSVLDFTAISDFTGVLDELLVRALHPTAVRRDVLRMEVTGVVWSSHVPRGSVGRVVLLRVEQMVGIKMIVLCFESPL